MNIIVLLNTGALIAYTAAAGIVAFSIRKKNSYNPPVIFLFIMLCIPLFICVSNILEHRNITNVLDEYEGFARDLFALFLLLFLYLDSIHRELDFRKKSEHHIKTALEEKTTLLKEIHHRVKNNLQLTSSLLSLQCETLNDDQFARYITIAKNRILSMAAVHEIIYKSHDLSHLAAHEFIQAIIVNLYAIFKPEHHDISIHRSLDTRVYFDVDIAIPVGLIVNELLSNALQHAFAEDNPGSITITLDYAPDILVLVIKDDGTGITEDIERSSKKGIGLMLVQTLVEQIKGTITVSSSDGTCISIQIPHSV